MIKRCLCVVPVNSPITGQSVISEKVISLFERSGFNLTIINTNGPRKKVKNIRIIFQLIWKYGQYDVIYFTPSRSFLGSIKDLTLMCMYRNFDGNICAHIHGADFVSFYSKNGNYTALLKRYMSRVNVFVVCHDVFMRDVKKIFPKSNITTVRNFA